MRRYLRLLGVQLRASTAVAMQYRVEFLGDGALALFWSPGRSCRCWSSRPPAGGGRLDLRRGARGDGLVHVMKGVLEGAVNPSLASVVEHIRKGTLDFVLLKPADAQFLVSTAKFEPWRVVDVLAGVALFGVAFHRMGRWSRGRRTCSRRWRCWSARLPSLYSLWILVVVGGLLRGEGRQPLVPLRLHLRRRALAGRPSSAARGVSSSPS